MKPIFSWGLFCGLALLSGCFNSTDFGSTLGLGGFPGCVSGKGYDTQSIQVNFQFPANALSMTIYRDGVSVFSTASQTTTQFLDRNLDEGTPYTYTCHALIQGVDYTGNNILTLSTVSPDPPTFLGISTAVPASANSVKVTWDAPNGVLTKQFFVYANVGGSINWNAAPVATIPGGEFTATVGSIGDQLPYSFGVRACSDSGVCDTNTATQTLTLPDTGAPLTLGATAVQMVNGQAVVTAPWVPANGAVAKRKVYMNTTGGTDLGTYTNVQTFVVADLTNVPTSLALSAAISSNTTYYFIVQDTDPTGNVNTNTNVVSINSGKTTPPVFTGITSLNAGTPSDTQVVAGWTAIADQSTDPVNGGSNYLVYMTSAAYGSSLADPCASSGVLLAQPAIAVGAGGGAVTYTLTGLTQRTTYGVCVKARDTAGNISATSSSLSITTKDITPPVFDGLQTISYNNATSQMQLTWNTSPSTDESTYQVQLWKNTATPTSGQITTLTVSNSTNNSGLNFTNTSFAFTSSDVIYAVVNACDNAAPTFNTTNNCTTYTTAQAKTLTLGLINPPAGFTGINPADCESSAQGAITVAWNAPPSWTQYLGFYVYQVNPDNSLTLLQNCPCSGNNCPNQITSCNVTGLNARRTYKLHVRAYDIAGNVTTYLSPTTSNASVQTLDTTPPVFSSNLSIGGMSNKVLTWNAATDNQYASEPGALINYNVYTKQSSTFVFTGGVPDGSLLGNTSALTYTDNSTLPMGQTFYYTVCAVDTSGNQECDQKAVSRFITETTLPTISNLATDKTTLSKSWNLTWSMSDSVAVTSVQVYRSTSASQGTATTSDAIVATGDGTMTSVTGLTGPMNQNIWVNYLVVVTNGGGLTAQAALSVYSTNNMTPTSVTRTEGVTTGGNFIIIRGNGFGSGVTVKVDTTACTSSWVFDSTEIGCLTPAHAAGTVNVSVNDPVTNSVGTAFGAYTYVAANSGSQVCDNPATWGANFAGGLGTSGAPYQICTVAQLQSLASFGNSFRLMDNLDLSTQNVGLTDPMTAPTFAPIATTNLGVFDGNGFTVANYHYENSGATNVGLFGSTNGGNTFLNLDIENFNLRGAGYVSLILGNPTCCGWSPVFTGIKAMGTLNVGATGYAGALIGYSPGAINGATVNVNITSAGGTVGGLAGGTGYNVSDATILAGITVTGSNNYIGGLIGYAGGNGVTLQNSSFTGSIIATSSNVVGGMVGNSYNGGFAISNSFVNATISGGQGVGGFVGGTDCCSGATTTVSGSAFSGNLLATYYAGGILGQMGGNISVVSNSHVSGTISASLGQAGGLLGYDQSANLTSITQSYLDGTANSDASGSGGLIGLIVGGAGPVTINQSFVSPASVVSSGANSTGLGVGGFVGEILNDTTTTIENSYCAGTVENLGAGNIMNVGGLIGVITGQGVSGDNETLTITNTYVSGPVLTSNGSVTAAGIIANQDNSNGTYTPTFTSTYWAYDAANPTFGTKRATSAAGSPAGFSSLTNAQMQLLPSFVDWDFTTTWQMPSSGPYLYPTLQGVTP